MPSAAAGEDGHAGKRKINSPQPGGLPRVLAEY